MVELYEKGMGLPSTNIMRLQRHKQMISWREKSKAMMGGMLLGSYVSKTG